MVQLYFHIKINDRQWIDGGRQIDGNNSGSTTDQISIDSGFDGGSSIIGIDGEVHDG